MDVCAYACQLLGASLFVASRSGSPDQWASLAGVIPEAGVDGLLQCLQVVPARSKAARALFYAATAPLAGGTGGEPIEARSGVTVRFILCTFCTLVSYITNFIMYQENLLLYSVCTAAGSVSRYILVVCMYFFRLFVYRYCSRNEINHYQLCTSSAQCVCLYRSCGN